MLRHRDRHGRRSVQAIRLDWDELIEQAHNAILRNVIRKAPELEAQLRQVRFELFDLPNLTEFPTGGAAPLATATQNENLISIAIFRRPIEVRAGSNKARVTLLRYAIAEALAQLLNVQIEIFIEN